MSEKVSNHVDELGHDDDLIVLVGKCSSWHARFPMVSWWEVYGPWHWRSAVGVWQPVRWVGTRTDRGPAWLLWTSPMVVHEDVDAIPSRLNKSLENASLREDC